MGNQFACAVSVTVMLAPINILIWVDHISPKAREITANINSSQSETDDVERERLIKTSSTLPESPHDFESPRANAKPDTTQEANQSRVETALRNTFDRVWNVYQHWRAMSALRFYLFLFSGYFVLFVWVNSAEKYRHHMKDSGDVVNDVIELVIRGYFVFRFGRISIRFRETPIPFFGFFVWFMVMYTITYWICPNIRLSPEHSVLTPLTFFLGLFVSLTLGFVFIQNIRDLYKAERRSDILYIIAHAIFAILYTVVLPLTPTKKKYHLHHTHWSLVLSCLLVSTKSRIVFVTQSFCLAVFVQGMAAFGVEPIFDVQR